MHSLLLRHTGELSVLLTGLPTTVANEHVRKTTAASTLTLRELASVSEEDKAADAHGLLKYVRVVLARS